MYLKMKKNKVDEFKEGRTVGNIAKKVKYSRAYISYLLNQQIAINEATAIKILMRLSEESLKLNRMFNENGIDYMINYFFEEEKENEEI